ncbi:Arylsulfate sulfotransferase AssT [bioreactor metagenome]|uniref:Arylsulfate sulfotransferase AssT n=1 Tax=bioreactor metagenome TaxID=1076179 RepID=A0A644X9J5_9ZZZZ
MKKWQKILIPVIVIVLLVLAALFVIRSGLLVRPTTQSLAADTEVPTYDILQVQADQEQQILSDYQAGTYTFAAPYIVQDPYEMNPLSALLIYEAAAPGEVEVTIQGDDAASTFTYVKTSKTSHFEVPIIGLYAGRENLITLKNGQGETKQLSITTEPLPVDFQHYTLEASLPEKMEPGVTLFTPCFEQTYTAILDANAQVRAYLTNKYMAHGTAMILASNGHMLSTGDEYKQIPYNMTSLWEFNWLGKVFKEIEVPNGVHHNITELANGDILAVSNNREMFTSGTREDVAVVIDRETGEVKKEYDFRNIVDEKRDPYTHFHPNIINMQNIDWMHMNGAILDSADNLLIVSSPIQSQVVAIDPDTSEIQWILGPHEGYEGTSAFLTKYLLTPVGEDFEWQWGQHDPTILPDFDNNPDTLDLLLFDNGQSRSFTQAGAISPENNYSRAVHYRIDLKAKTVEQLWEYGKECGAECYATYLGDADYLPQTGNVLVDFGGEIRKDGVAIDDIVGGVFGNEVTNSRVREVTQDKELVYSVKVTESKYTVTAETYQAERMPLYVDSAYDYNLGQIQGQRLGTLVYNSETDMVQAPNLYVGKIKANLSRIFVEEGRLVADGTITYDNKVYLLGRAFFILRSETKTYVFATSSSVNGRFFLSLDTSQLESGTYQISIVGVVREGNDQLNGVNHSGHTKTDYKITIP